MIGNQKMKNLLLSSAFVIGSAFAASAATVTVDFDSLGNGPDSTVDLGGGFTADFLRIVSGNCADGSCLAINPNETTTIRRTDGTAFSLTSYWYQLLGRSADLFVQAFDMDGNQVADDFWQGDVDGSNEEVTVFPSDFINIFSLTFDNLGNGNIRVDDLALSYDAQVAPVPLPAAGLMLVMALGGFGTLRRRTA